MDAVKRHVPFEEFRRSIVEKYPEARIVKSEYIEFDWILIFPSELDEDIFCLTEEFGQMTYHRYSREEFQSFGFSIPL